MQRYGRGLAVLGLGLMLLAAAPSLGHHAFEAEYDVQSPMTLKGVVTKVDWVNPHAHIFINVEDDQGVIRNFAVELGPPYALVRGGWLRDTVKIGDTVTVADVCPARNGSNRAGATRDTALILATGETLVMR